MPQNNKLFRGHYSSDVDINPCVDVYRWSKANELWEHDHSIFFGTNEGLDDWLQREQVTLDDTTYHPKSDLCNRKHLEKVWREEQLSQEMES